MIGDLPVPAPVDAVAGAASVTEEYWQVGDGGPPPGTGTVGRQIEWLDAAGAVIGCSQSERDSAAVTIDQATYQAFVDAWDAYYLTVAP